MLITVFTRSPHPCILSQINPLHIFQPYFINIHLNIIRPSTPKSPEWSGFRTKILNEFFISPCVLHARQSQLSWFYYPNNIWWRLEFMKLLIMQSFSVFYHFIPLRTSTLFSNTLYLSYSFCMTNVVSHSNKTRGKILVLYILILTLSDKGPGKISRYSVWLWTGLPDDRGSIHGRGKKFFL
jgi:hypothetical protein